MIVSSGARSDTPSERAGRYVFQTGRFPYKRPYRVPGKNDMTLSGKNRFPLAVAGSPVRAGQEKTPGPAGQFRRAVLVAGNIPVTRSRSGTIPPAFPANRPCPLIRRTGFRGTLFRHITVFPF